MGLHDVVSRLIGPTLPVGEAHEDNRRLSNLEALIGLTDNLLRRIDFIAELKSSSQHSVSTAGKRATKFLVDLGIKID